jgi:excisionase family DNA binding protein
VPTRRPGVRTWPNRETGHRAGTRALPGGPPFCGPGHSGRVLAASQRDPCVLCCGRGRSSRICRDRRVDRLGPSLQRRYRPAVEAARDATRDATRSRADLPRGPRAVPRSLEPLRSQGLVGRPTGFLSVKTQEAGDLLGISRPTLVRLPTDDEIPYSMRGRDRRVLLADVLASRERARRATGSTRQMYMPPLTPMTWPVM